MIPLEKDEVEDGVMGRNPDGGSWALLLCDLSISFYSYCHCLVELTLWVSQSRLGYRGGVFLMYCDVDGHG